MSHINSDNKDSLIGYDLQVKYNAKLKDFSFCIRPVIEAAYERNFIQGFQQEAIDLSKYCLSERREVEKFRNELLEYKHNSSI